MKRNLLDGKLAAIISVVLICLGLVVIPTRVNAMGHLSSSVCPLSNGVYNSGSWGTAALRLY
ncbi:MAG: hypothetical protein F6K11_23645 [Leptolyngbya sp. SIO3F4]|nr:hypothetical protein [Leptolyngbya sp. SIO3F4]